MQMCAQLHKSATQQALVLIPYQPVPHAAKLHLHLVSHPQWEVFMPCNSSHWRASLPCLRVPISLCQLLPSLQLLIVCFLCHMILHLPQYVSSCCSQIRGLPVQICVLSTASFTKMVIPTLMHRLGVFALQAPARLQLLGLLVVLEVCLFPACAISHVHHVY